MFFRPISSKPGAVALLVPLLFAACNRKTANAPPPRYAVLRFENLSGDPDLSWLGRAIGESLPVSLDGKLDGPVLGSSSLIRTAPGLGPRPAAAPGDSSERAEALAAGANRAISGYIERVSGRIRITAMDEDLPTGKTVRVVSATAASPIGALDRLAHEFSPQARPPLTANTAALRDYTIALESPAAASAALLENAVSLDPGLGPAWLALTRLALGRNDRAGAAALIAEARSRKLDALSEANLALEAANLAPDRAARIAALRKVSSLNPADAILLRSLAEAEMNAGQFSAAAADWRKLTSVSPNDPGVWNSLGYALSYSGDYAGALAALQRYSQMRPNDPNASDSIGDLDYSFRKFREAADSYLAAYRKQNDFEQFGDLYKAAWAKFRAGDKPGADALFAQFREKRVKSDVLFDLLAADWLYRTGRQREAVASLRKVTAETQSEPLRVSAYAQLTIWDLLAGDRGQAAKDAALIGSKITSAPAFIARFVALPSASAAEWQLRAEKTIPLAAGSLRPLALGYALLLDGKRDAAVPVWQQLVEQSSATDFFARAVYAGLAHKPFDRPLLPETGGVNQFAAVAGKLRGD